MFCGGGAADQAREQLGVMDDLQLLRGEIAVERQVVAAQSVQAVRARGHDAPRVVPPQGVDRPPDQILELRFLPLVPRMMVASACARFAPTRAYLSRRTGGRWERGEPLRREL